MKLIAHRGLIEGPNKNLENNPTYITKILELGFDAEIDLHRIDNKLYLGHDDPTYEINESFLNHYGLWIHAKNLDALHWLCNTNLVYFWHENDKFTLTSNNYIWSYPNQLLTDKSIMLMPEWQDPEFTSLNLNCYGICSDYVIAIKELIKFRK